MDSICAVLDVQGFMINKRFHPVEVCVVSEFDMTNMRLDAGIPWKKLSFKNRCEAIWVSNNHHGIPYNAPTMAYTSNEAKNVVRAFYEMASTKTKSLIACKSQLAYQFIKECGLPGINLTCKGATWKNLSSKLKGRVPCQYHVFPAEGKDLKCSMVASLVLWNWIEEEKKKGHDVWYDYPQF